MDTNWAPAVCGGEKKMWISKHTPTQELLVSLILFSPQSSVCSLTERSGLLAHWEICKDNEKSREKHEVEGLQDLLSAKQNPAYKRCGWAKKAFHFHDQLWIIYNPVLCER